MNKEKSEAKFIYIPDCHAFKIDLWCAGIKKNQKQSLYVSLTVMPLKSSCGVLGYSPVYQCRGYVMNKEKSKAKFICIPDCHAFKIDLWCAGSS
jgi:hypothetical protein